MVHTTKFRRVTVFDSRRASGFDERLEVAPLIWFVDWKFVVCAIAVIDLCGWAARDESFQRLVEHDRIWRTRSH